MCEPDEPVLKNSVPSSASEIESVRSRVLALLGREQFGVLCTQGEGQPYGSVIAIAADESGHILVFATSRSTRKYRLLESCDHVALVVDDRPRHPDELMTVEAVTATGRAVEVSEPEDLDRWREVLLAKHPLLRSFILSPSTALFRVDVVRYLHVWRFQEVRQWLPPREG